MSVARARTLRRRQTDAERSLWNALRDRRLEGFKFRRQAPARGFVVDFVCRERGIVVELDGGQHAARAHADARRTAVLARAGLRVLRFWNDDVLRNREGVLQTILAALRDPHPDPLPQAGEGAGKLRAKRRDMARARLKATGVPLPPAGEGGTRAAGG